MPNTGTLLTIASIGVVSALFIFITIRMKRSKVLTRAPYRPHTRRTAQPATPAPVQQTTAQPAPPATPAPAPTPAPQAPARTTQQRSTFRTWFEAFAGILFAGVIVFAVLMATVAVIEYYKRTPTGGVANATSTTVARSKYFVGRTHYLSEIMDFWWTDENLNIEPEESWNMVDTFKLESPDGRQFNDDGTIFRGSNPNDIGLGQLNLIESRDEIREAGCDVEDPACQFKVSRIIYNKYGHKRWLAYPKILALDVNTTPVVAPVGSWSEPVAVEQGSSCFWDVDRLVEARDEEGVKHIFEPGKVSRFNAKSLEYSVPDEPAGMVKIKCRVLPKK